MLTLRAFFPRIALLLLLVFAPVSLARGNASFIERIEADVSGAFRAGFSEIDPGEIKLFQPSFRDAIRRARAIRTAVTAGEKHRRFTIVADLRPTRIACPVQRPPVRRPPDRFLN
ncbi:hypothetical protein [Sorangium cellulosum]|jgi:hypothetical protein|uniref:hypothetical protein n=1 Tax=Sorangium cellulosum TaxID=56 RepID=UPI001012A88B|nr:hypothetical protein [Sorangium cellulosum]